jgi:hypothetical protein
MSVAGGPTDVDLFTDVSERDMDFLFCEEIECSPACAAWLLEKTAATGANCEVVRIARSLVEAEGEYEKAESIVDSRDSTTQFQHPHWYKGASHKWESLIPTICANVCQQQPEIRLKPPV